MLGQLLARRNTPRTESRYSLSDVAEWFSYNGLQYPLGGNFTTSFGVQRAEAIPATFEALTNQAYSANGIVAACVMARLQVFSQVRFMFQRFRDGRPGDLFGMPVLDLLNETPWLLPRLEQDASLAGNAYVWRDGDMLRHLRPDWVAVILRQDPTLATTDDIVGYLFFPEGPSGTVAPVQLAAEEVAHYAPIPDPLARYRGMSWLSPVLREIESDISATRFKKSYFENGATPNLVVSFDAEKTLEQVREFRDLWNDAHQGAEQAFKTAFLGGGADVTVAGSNLDQANLKNVQGAIETRIAVAAGVPAVVLGLSEGMQGSSLNAGNYNQAKRLFGDRTLRHLWWAASRALSKIIDVPSDARLWYDASGVDFMQEDAKDDAEILATRAQAIRALTDAGYEQDAVVDAVVNSDLSRLSGNHTGLFSVQLQPPMSAQPELEPVEDDEGGRAQVFEIVHRHEAVEDAAR